MTQMAADNRVCAKAMAALMTTAPTVYPVERAVQFVPRAYVFGHYDSRGGAALVVADTIAKAIVKYARVFGWDENLEDLGQKEYLRDQGLQGQALEDEYNAWKKTALQDIEDEHIFTCQVVVCDGSLPAEEAELDADYAETGYSYGTIQSRCQDYKGKTMDWQDAGSNKILVLWKGEPPKPLGQNQYLPQYEERLEKMDSLGEDAFGLILML